MTYKRKYLYQRIVNAKLFIDAHYCEEIDLDRITCESHFSKYHFIRLFKKAYGLTPNQYLVKKRIDKAKIALTTTDRTIKEICHSLNFSSQASFTHLFKRITSKAPTQYRNSSKLLEKKTRQNPLSQVPGCFTLAHIIEK